MNRIIKTFLLSVTVSLLFSLSIVMAVFADEGLTVQMTETDTMRITVSKGDRIALTIKNGEEQIPVSEVAFTTSKKKVAKVTKSGLLKAKKKGKATISVSYNGLNRKIKVTVLKKGADSGSQSSSGAGKLTCSSGSTIKTGKVVTLKLDKTAATHAWTWTFTGSCSADARVLKATKKKVTFTVWPTGGDLTIHGTDPAGATISYSFKVKQTSKWAKREQFRKDALAAASTALTPADKIRFFCDYIADRASYVSGNYFSIIDGKNGDCVSYSVAFKFLADAVGIETIIVKNGGSRSHYWNQVKLDGIWYNVDAQGYDTSRSRRWVLCSDERHNWYASTTYSAQNGIQYPVSPANICNLNYGE